jgi:hypothetical protein
LTKTLNEIVYLFSSDSFLDTWCSTNDGNSTRVPASCTGQKVAEENLFCGTFIFLSGTTSLLMFGDIKTNCPLFGGTQTNKTPEIILFGW